MSNSNEFLQCADLRKKYPGQSVYALGDDSSGVSFTVGAGELFALLGPSGCGKTTMLRIIGGFIQPTTGTVTIADRDVTSTPSHSRPTNTVFQSYALFPHMNLAGNVGFGLKMERVGRKERIQRVDEALRLVGLGGMGDRKVTELSGGQAQRAALARSIIKRPQVLLLDEPLGALDLKLRREMQSELLGLKEATETTFVHVTHDQEEACAIADRIAVMDKGKIVQVDTPFGLYRAPRSSYVASFINAGTLIRGSVSRSGDVIEVVNESFRISGPAPKTLDGSSKIAALLGPDRLRIEDAETAGRDSSDGRQRAYGVVHRRVFTGVAFELWISSDANTEIRVTVPVEEVALSEGLTEAGNRVAVSWSPKDVIFVEDTADDFEAGTVSPSANLPGSPAPVEVSDG